MEEDEVEFKLHKYLKGKRGFWGSNAEQLGIKVGFLYCCG